MKNRNLYIIKQTPSLFLTTGYPGNLEFNIIKSCRSHYFKLTDEFGNIFLTGIVSGTVNEILHQIRELKKAVLKPNRFEKEQLEDEGIYFVIKNTKGYPIASSYIFFYHRDCRNAISALKILIPTTRVNGLVKCNTAESSF